MGDGRAAVPAYDAREGDHVIAGSNNATLILGRDQVDGPDSGAGGGSDAGMATLVVGRVGSGIDDDDSAMVQVSMRGGALAVPDGSTAVVRADNVTIVGRRRLTIVVGDAELIVDVDGSIELRGRIKIGAGAIENALLASPTIAWLMSHTHKVPIEPTPVITLPAIQPFPQTARSKAVVE